MTTAGSQKVDWHGIKETAKDIGACWDHVDQGGFARAFFQEKAAKLARMCGLLLEPPSEADPPCPQVIQLAARIEVLLAEQKELVEAVELERAGRLENGRALVAVEAEVTALKGEIYRLQGKHSAAMAHLAEWDNRVGELQDEVTALRAALAETPENVEALVQELPACIRESCIPGSRCNWCLSYARRCLEALRSRSLPVLSQGRADR